MHVPDGFLPTAMIAGGYLATGAITAYSLRKINAQDDPRAGVPKAALLTAAFFIASTIRIQIPGSPASIHLLLSGLMGVVLGYYAFPAILVGLILQFLVFGHGGITSLGVNALIMGLPAIAAHGAFQLLRATHIKHPAWVNGVGFLAGLLGVSLAVVMFYGIMINTIPADIDIIKEREAIAFLSLWHAPVALAEGIITAFLIHYLRRVRPDMVNLTPIAVG